MQRTILLFVAPACETILNRLNTPVQKAAPVFLYRVFTTAPCCSTDEVYQRKHNQKIAQLSVRLNPNRPRGTTHDSLRQSNNGRATPLSPPIPNRALMLARRGKRDSQCCFQGSGSLSTNPPLGACGPTKVSPTRELLPRARRLVP